MPLLVTNVVWPGEDQDPVGALAEHLGLPATQITECRLLRRSVDARRRPPVWLCNYLVALATPQAEAQVLGRNVPNVRRFSDRDARRHRAVSVPVPRRAWTPGPPVVVVGAGPAGLFCALRLAESGAPVVLLDRGGPVEDRHGAVRQFWRHRQLDTENNVVYGEGGAGAFSDGKIYTRRRDGDLGWIFQRLVDHGADPGVLEEGWAHLGTDRIREILPRLRDRLAELGCDIRFHTRVDGIDVDAGRVVGVRLADGSHIAARAVVVAAGHSARDTWQWMLDAGAAAELRPIHIGARVEHPQKLIDQARYGSARGDMPPASYRFVSNPGRGRTRPGAAPPARQAHTFCMCPGGTVVAATAQRDRVVVNGMSYSGRRAWFANAAVIVQVEREDFDGDDPLAGVRYQDAIESAAFTVGGGDYRAPGQRVVDLLAGRPSTDLPRVSHPLGATPCDLRDVLPAPIVEGLAAALRHFDRKLPGFAGPDAVLLAPETRTTAPLRFLRGEDMASTTVAGLLPVGEGAGYAGGIVSAALDGMRAADALAATQPRAATG